MAGSRKLALLVEAVGGEDGEGYGGATSPVGMAVGWSGRGR